MNFDSLLAKIVISIAKNGVVDSGLVSNNTELFSDIASEIDLFNTILISHKKRYQNCYTDEQRNCEFDLLRKNIKAAFKYRSQEIISQELLSCVFDIVNVRDVSSNKFKEICTTAVELIASCKTVEIRIAIASRIVSIIVRSSLYGAEPYDTILSALIQELDDISEKFGDVKQTLFLGA